MTFMLARNNAIADAICFLTRGRMLVIWGCDQYSPAAADWHDGQIAHDAHARFARRDWARRWIF
jgi:hypothetical protein